VAIGRNHKGDIFFYDTAVTSSGSGSAGVYQRANPQRFTSAKLMNNGSMYRTGIAELPLHGGKPSLAISENGQTGEKLFVSLSKTTVLKKSSDESPTLLVSILRLRSRFRLAFLGRYHHRCGALKEGLRGERKNGVRDRRRQRATSRKTPAESCCR